MMPKLVRGSPFSIIGRLPLMYSLTAFVSLRRIQEFLTETELLDEYAALQAGVPNAAEISGADHENEIGLGHATFTWSAIAATRTTDTERTFRLVIEDNLVFQRGTLNVIVGT
jgi:hypothetical protein